MRDPGASSADSQTGASNNILGQSLRIESPLSRQQIARELTPTGTSRPRTRRQSSAQLHVFTATMITTTISFDDSVLALASSAEAVLNTFTVSGTGGSPRVAGIWSEVKSDMEKLLPGALVRLQDEENGEPKFGLIPTAGALSTRNGRLHVKISMDGTASGSFFNSDSLATSVSGIWPGVISNTTASVVHNALRAYRPR